MSFQILDENNKAIPINLIDEEVAKFWNVEIDKKYYLYPNTRKNICKVKHIVQNF